jgi:hypothetical protein
MGAIEGFTIGTVREARVGLRSSRPLQKMERTRRAGAGRNRKTSVKIGPSPSTYPPPDSSWRLVLLFSSSDILVETDLFSCAPRNHSVSVCVSPLDTDKAPGIHQSQRGQEET